MGTLNDRVTLVTGGQRGLGAAILREFAAEGAICVGHYRGPQEADAANELVKELKGKGTTAIAIPADVTSAAERKL